MNKIYPYAGFWKRAIAFIIDMFVLSIPLGILMAALLVSPVMELVKSAAANAEPSPDIMLGIIGRYLAGGIVSWLVWWLYFALMESGKRQATLGKMALGIKVTGPHGKRMSFARATGRFFAKIISGMPIYFGFYMAGFTRYRQALHDMIADTYVVDKTYQPATEELPALPFSKGFCVTGILVAVAPVVLYIGMIVLAIVIGVAASVHEAEQAPVANRPAAITQQVEP